MKKLQKTKIFLSNLTKTELFLCFDETLFIKKCLQLFRFAKYFLLKIRIIGKLTCWEAADEPIPTTTTTTTTPATIPYHQPRVCVDPNE